MPDRRAHCRPDTSDTIEGRMMFQRVRLLFDNLVSARPGRSSSREAEDFAAPSRRARLALPENRTTVYAIGDVHGCLELLLRIENMIVGGENRRGDRPTLIV